MDPIDRCWRHHTTLVMDPIRGSVCPICDDDLLHAPERATARLWMRALRWLRLHLH